MAKSDWREVDVAELSDSLVKLYHGMKQHYREYAETKRVFEDAMQQAFADNLAEDEELKFGYNFGKLAIAVGEKRERKPRKSVEQKPSLSDWLKARQDSGREC